MMRRALVVFLLIAGAGLAQIDTGTTRNVRVKLGFANGACDLPMQVTLAGGGKVVGEATASEQCEVDFARVPVGRYLVTVSSKTLSASEPGNIEVTPNGSAEFELRVKRPRDFEWTYGMSANALVSTSDLNVPARARREFGQANQLLARHDLQQALQKLNNAIAFYPRFAVAYNNMGVIYARLGEPAREKEAFEKAISINDHFALAYLNLGRMHLMAEDFAGAEAVLNCASAFAPTDPVPLLLLAYTQLLDRRFDEAVASSRKAHAHQGHPAVVHRVAARALEQRKEFSGAIAELEQFLEEEPIGSQASEALAEIRLLRTISQ